MIKYVTIVNYIDVGTGEIVSNKEIGNRNFLEIKREIKIEYKNGKHEKRINHYGNIGSAGDGNNQLRLL